MQSGPDSLSLSVPRAQIIPPSGAPQKPKWDQIIPLLVCLWNPESRPDHPSSGVHLEPKWDQILPLLIGYCSMEPTVGTRLSNHSLNRNQIFPLLIYLK